MLRNTWEVRNHSSISIDKNDKLLSTNEDSSSLSINISSVFASNNLNVKVADDLSKSSMKTHPCPSDKKIFSAPPGVIPYHVKWSSIRRKSSDQRLIFVWPQKTFTRGSCLSSLVPIVRRLLIGLVLLGVIHIWPGEFLPTTVPLTTPLPRLPVKCSVIEPLWEDDDRTAIRRS